MSDWEEGVGTPEEQIKARREYRPPAIRSIDIDASEAQGRTIGSIVARAGNLERACRATLIFHSGKAWCEHETEWEQLTGSAVATTKSLCDFVRRCLES